MFNEEKDEIVFYSKTKNVSITVTKNSLKQYTIKEISKSLWKDLGKSGICLGGFEDKNLTVFYSYEEIAKYILKFAFNIEDLFQDLIEEIGIDYEEIKILLLNEQDFIEDFKRKTTTILKNHSIKKESLFDLTL